MVLRKVQIALRGKIGGKKLGPTLRGISMYLYVRVTWTQYYRKEEVIVQSEPLFGPSLVGIIRNHSDFLIWAMQEMGDRPDREVVIVND